MGFSSKFRSFVYFTVLVVSVAETACPPEDLIQPCFCHRDRPYSPDTVRCANFTRASDLEDVMSGSNDFVLDELEVYQARMDHIPSSILLSKKTRYLEVYDSDLDSIFDQEPDPENHLRNIVLTTTRLGRGVEWNLFRTLTNLKRIWVHSVDVPVVGKLFRTYVSKHLTSITLYNSKTEKILNDAFQDMGELDYVDIQANLVSTLRRSMFAYPSKIKSFYFGNNRIESVPEDMFDGMPDLREVGLGSNPIKVLPERTYAISNNGLPMFKFPASRLDCDCSLQWIVHRIVDGYVWRAGMIPPKVQIKEQFWAWCGTPANLAGKSVKDLTEEDFSYCGPYIRRLPFKFLQKVLKK